MGTAGAKVEQLETNVEGTVTMGRTPVAITIGNASNPTLARWDGEIEVTHPSFGRQTIRLSYRQSPSGRWRGTMYYFSLFGSDGLATWSQLRPQFESARVRQLHPGEERLRAAVGGLQARRQLQHLALSGDDPVDPDRIL